ncbi:hypothetical protein KP509_38G005900 [Ceratopteris richardii]|uniref:Uncharacterized protein n=1 Tax=Ceratopteris richardii TaxID=49495 RepID=A0A8T2Q2U9_CERRI|nr:hypothetical protein KP509_38G005900 [Ceratopteris richardii]
MGCSASTLDTEQSVSRCRNRKHFIKTAVQHRHAFAAAHAAYIQSLKNTGAAIRQFGEGYAKDEMVTETALDVETPSYLPPPLPHFLALSSHEQPSRMSRATSMPPLWSSTQEKATAMQTASLQKNSNPNHAITTLQHSEFSPLKNLSSSPQEREGDELQDPFHKRINHVADVKPPLRHAVLSATPSPPPPKGSRWPDYLNVFPLTTEGEESIGKADVFEMEDSSIPTPLSEGNLVHEVEERGSHDQLNAVSDKEPPQTPEFKGSEKTFRQILRELDDKFLAAFESGKTVSKLLEAQRMNYHSSFADASESLNHSRRVLRVMSWERDSHLPLTNGESLDLFHNTGNETHASTLDKLLAWEKKLHDEVKAGEVIRLELERKSQQLRSQKKHDEDSMAVNKIKAAVKSIQTRYLVGVQAVDAAASEIDKLRDHCLYSQLVDLARELMFMWNILLQCHEQQYQLVEEMQMLSRPDMPTATDDFQHKNTLQLESETNLLHQHLENLIITQKEYMDSVYHWLRLHLIQIESDEKDTTGSPQKMSTPPVYLLCKDWISELDKLPGNVTLHAVKAFSGLVHELASQQNEELKQRKKLEGLTKELLKKERNFKVQEAKYNERLLAQHSSDGMQVEVPGDANPLKERERMLQLLRETVREERDKYEHMCSKSGSMALSSLEKGLPPLLTAMKDFSNACFQCYGHLHHFNSAPKYRIGY